jgi:hypothetical protein
MRWLGVIAGCVGATVALASLAAANDIGLFSAPDCSSCNLTAPVGVQSTFYAVYTNTGAFPDITGAEFRITGIPSDWSATWSPSPLANLNLGTPLGAGVNVAFPSPGPTAPRVVLGTITVTPVAPADNQVFRVTRHVTPSNINFSCPLFTFTCQCFTKICVLGGSMLVNSDHDCRLAVRESTWSNVRQLYRR